MIYADNAATTSLMPEALEEMLPFLTSNYGNPSSLHSWSKLARKAISNAREIIAECIGALPEEIIFTSGGSESDNWAIKNFAFSSAKEKHQILTSPIEHHAILNSCVEASRLYGCSMAHISVDNVGIVSIDDYRAKLSNRTAGVSIMFANNEVGTIEDIKTLALIAKEHNILFHTDAVQAVGHIPIDVKDLSVDMLSASAHKFNGPKGIGFFYVKKGVPLVNFINGGQQESSRRAGTENVAFIVGMATALKNNCENLSINTFKLKQLVKCFKEIINIEIPEVIYNGNQANCLPGLISLSIPNCSGESLLHILDLKGIAVSTGAACNSSTTEISHVLKALNISDDLAKGTLRISFGRDNTIEDAERLAQTLVSCVKKLKGCC